MKKTLSVVKNVLVWLVVVLAVFMMVFTIISVTTFDRADRNLFGYKAFIVLSDSMSSTDFSAGDLVLVKSVDPTTLEPGDIISFSSQDSANYGETVTHKIRALTTDSNGDPAFITYGTTTGTDDEALVSYPFIIGEYKTHLAGVGKLFYFIKSTPGYICCILLPFLILILLQGWNSIKLFRQYKSEQMETMQAERQRLEIEREESRKMMEELLRLKSQLAEKETAPAVPVAAEPVPVAEIEAEDTKTEAEDAETTTV